MTSATLSLSQTVNATHSVSQALHAINFSCFLQIVLMGLIESYRANGGIDDDQGLDRLYPGGDYFDPLGLADDPDSFAELRVMHQLRLYTSHQLQSQAACFLDA